MSITKILSDEDLKDSEKLEKVAEIVAGARKKYGNGEEEIPDVKVTTAQGSMFFTHLDDNSKVAILDNEARNIKMSAVTYVENHPGSLLDKKVEELIAINTYFANVANGTKFEYL